MSIVRPGFGKKALITAINVENRFQRLALQKLMIMASSSITDWSQKTYNKILTIEDEKMYQKFLKNPNKF